MNIDFAAIGLILLVAMLSFACYAMFKIVRIMFRDPAPEYRYYKQTTCHITNNRVVKRVVCSWDSVANNLNHRQHLREGWQVCTMEEYNLVTELSAVRKPYNA
jgi:hypothetical protein